jgi:hypothetical protein
VNWDKVGCWAAGSFSRPRKILAADKIGSFSGYIRISPANSWLHFLAQKAEYLSFHLVQQLSPPIAAAIAGDLKPCPDIVIERCKTAWDSFKGFNRDAVVTAATHALAVVRSHYPGAGPRFGTWVFKILKG